MKKHEYKIDRFENGLFVEQLKVKAFDAKDAVKRARILYPNSEVRESRKDSNGVYINTGDFKKGDTI